MPAKVIKYVNSCEDEIERFHKTEGMTSNTFERLVKVEASGGAIGWCLSPLDIAYNKAEAGREKDIVYLAELFRCGIVHPSEIKAAMDTTGTATETAVAINARVQEAMGRVD